MSAQYNLATPGHENVPLAANTAASLSNWNSLPTPSTPSSLGSLRHSQLASKLGHLSLQTPIVAQSTRSPLLPTPQTDTSFMDDAFDLISTPLRSRSTNAIDEVSTVHDPDVNLLEHLPREISLVILSKLSARDLSATSAVSRECRLRAGDNSLWLPHVQCIATQYGISIANHESLRTLYCDVKNRETLYRCQRQNARRLASGYSPVLHRRDAPTERCQNSLPPTPSTISRPRLGKENALPAPVLYSSSIRITCPSCEVALSASLNTIDFVLCNSCGYLFCDVCRQEAPKHSAYEPCRRPSLSSKTRLGIDSASLRESDSFSTAIISSNLQGATRVVVEPQPPSPNKRQASISSKQQVTRRLRRL